MSKQETGNLIDGIEFKGKQQKEFVLVPVETAGELFAAEQESGGLQNELAFNGALLARQLERVGDLPGPFSFEQIQQLSPRDFGILRLAQQKLNQVDDDPK